MSTLPATAIEVRAFRHILIWPVLLRGRPQKGKNEESWLQPWVEHLTADGLWKESQPDCGKVDARFSYSQIVYFHPSVRDMLFGDGDDKLTDRTTRILERDDVREVLVELGEWQPPGVKLRFDIDRIELYLCKPCVALFVIEVKNPRRQNSASPVMLSELQDFTDQFRRIYPPFWWDDKPDSDESHEPTSPGLCLRSLEWIGIDGQPIRVAGQLPGADDYAAERDVHQSKALRSPKKHFDNFTRIGAEPPVFDHWMWFWGRGIRPAFTQAHIKASRSGSVGELFIQQLLDERIPVMSYFAVDRTADLSTGDFDRLTFVDASGSDSFPYQQQFLDSRRVRYCYDRFAHYGTRYFCSGYGFTMLGNADNRFYRTTLQEHFSHHYFCMGLIAHFQRAALLYFADELADSPKELLGRKFSSELGHRGFQDRAEEIQHRFLKFRGRAFFSEVSNQLQGQELFRLWFEVLETQRLFDQVDSFSQRLATVLGERESRWLERLAGTVVPWGFAVSVASFLISAKSSLHIVDNAANGPDWVFWCILVGCAVLGFRLSWMFNPQEPRQAASSLWRRILPESGQTGINAEHRETRR